MKTFTALITILFATLIAINSFAQNPATSPLSASAPAAAQPAPPGGQPNPQEMMKQMMDMSKLNENHKLLSEMDGNWNYTIKMWMNPDPNAKPQESKGTASRKSIMGGRYVMMDVNGKMQMPGEDGKMKDVQFKGMAVEGYDNIKKKFIGSLDRQHGYRHPVLRRNLRSRDQDVHIHERNGARARNENTSARSPENRRQQPH